MNAPPIGDNKIRWPDEVPYEGAWHEFWPTYQEFWETRLDVHADVAEPAPVGEFLTWLRDGAEGLPSVRVR